MPGIGTMYDGREFVSNVNGKIIEKKIKENLEQLSLEDFNKRLKKVGIEILYSTALTKPEYYLREDIQVVIGPLNNDGNIYLFGKYIYGGIK